VPQRLKEYLAGYITLRNVSVNAAAFTRGGFIGEVASLDIRLEIDDTYPQSSGEMSSGSSS
jgi:hypothetical protein